MVCNKQNNIIVLLLIYKFYRGTSFRETLMRLEEVRSLMPSHHNIMALTATASKTLRGQIESVLGMRTPLGMIKSPNMRLCLLKIKGFNSYEVPPVFIVKELRSKLTLLPRITIFCNRKTDSTTISIEIRKVFHSSTWML